MKRVIGIARSGAGRVGLVAAVIMASVVALSAPASAHAAVLSGTTVCSDGAHVVSWSIGNDWPTPMSIVTATATMNGQTYAVVGYTSPVYENFPTSAISNLPAGTGTVTLHVHSKWPDNVEHDRSVSVDLIHDCNAGGTTTTLPATTTTPSTLPATTTTPSTLPATTTTIPTTTTTAAATTTTAAPTTTTTAPATTTSGGATTTTVPGATTTTTTTPGSTTSTSIVVSGSTTISLPTTTTTVPPSTTSAPTTLPAATSTTDTTPVTPLGSTIVTTTTADVPLTQQAVSTTLAPGATSLPRTGSNSSMPVVFGAGCLAVGAVLALRKRKTWTRP